MENKIQRLLLTILLMTPLGASSTLAISSSKLGEKVYNDTCIACHGEDGKGDIDGVPDLTKADGRLTKKDVVLINSIKRGLETSGSSLSMPAKGGDDEMTDRGVKSVLEYIRQKFGRGKTKSPIE